MKYISLSSILIGTIVFVTIVVFHYTTYQQLDEMGGVRDLLDIFIYGRTNKKLLYIFTLAGLFLSFFAIKRSTINRYKKYGWIGIAICVVDLLILWTTGS